MNIHVSDEIRNRWPQYEFVSKPFTLSNGKTYIRARHRAVYYWVDQNHILCVEDDWIWHETTIGELLK